MTVRNAINVRSSDKFNGYQEPSSVILYSSEKPPTGQPEAFCFMTFLKIAGEILSESKCMP